MDNFPINRSGAKNSSIVAMTQELVSAMRNSGEEYLMLNRGINSVVPIDLSQLIPLIDFNAPAIQNYSAMAGKKNLLQAINSEYFGNKANTENLLVTAGGIAALDIAFQSIQCTEVLLPRFFWGTYAQILNIRGLKFKSYQSLNELKKMDRLANTLVLICDPGNPLGEKVPDEDLMETIAHIEKAKGLTIVDSPYRRLFYDSNDTFYQSLLAFKRVIITESFSKSLGLSGQRIGFIHCANSAFIHEAALRLQYASNGINAFAQVLVTKLLESPEGIAATKTFKQKTTDQIKQNIAYLKNRGFLAEDFYKTSEPLGIFSVININPDTLFLNKIGGVGLDYFTLDKNPKYKEYSRILVSIDHQKFVSFFDNIKQ